MGVVFDDLTPEEAATLGVWLDEISRKSD